MAAYVFVLSRNAMPQAVATAAFPAEAFEDVQFKLGEVGVDGNYTATFSSNSETSLGQAVNLFGSFARGQRAVVREGEVKS